MPCDQVVNSAGRRHACLDKGVHGCASSDGQWPFDLRLGPFAYDVIRLRLSWSRQTFVIRLAGKRGVISLSGRAQERQPTSIAQWRLGEIGNLTSYR